MDPTLSALVSRLNDAAHRASTEAQAIEDPSTRRAICDLADAIGEIARHLKAAD